MNYTEADEVSVEDLEAASEKLDQIKREWYEQENPVKSMSTTGRLHVISLLKKASISCSNQAQQISTEVNGNWTHRRQSFADSAARKKDVLLNRARILNCLANQWEDGTLDKCLFKIRSKSDIDFVFYTGLMNPPTPEHGQWYHDEYPAKKKKADSLGITSKEVEEKMRKLLKFISADEANADNERAKLLREKLKAIHTYDIPGFFPTPDDLIDKMIDYAQLEDGLTLLEPSAGVGSILDRIVYHGFKLRMDAVEHWPSLEEILRLKGYNSSCEDILATKTIQGNGWDRILMNPPFEKGQDLVHVRHCFDTYLKPGGILVSIMSAGVMTNQKQQDFRDWVMEYGGHFYINGQEFKKAFNPTGVATVTLVMQK